MFSGKVAEWLKAFVCYAKVSLFETVGSNPILSVYGEVTEWLLCSAVNRVLI